MNIEEFEEAFEEYSEEEFLEFERVENKLSKRADIHAFLLLDRLCPSNISIVSGAEHDMIYLSVESDELSKVITREQILELSRCGVGYSSSSDLYMFV